MKLTGFEFQNSEFYREVFALWQNNLLATFESAKNGEPIYLTPPSKATPIYADAEGNKFIAVPRKKGFVFTPYITSGEVSQNSFSSGGSGFYSIPDAGETIYSRGAAIDRENRSREETAGSKPARSSSASKNEKEFSDELKALLRESIKNYLIDELKNSIGTALQNYYLDKNLTEGLDGKLEEAFNFKNLSDIVGGFGVNQLENYLFDSVWTTDDSDSLAEQLLKQYVKKLTDSLLNSLKDKLTDLITDKQIPVKDLPVKKVSVALAAARVGDKDNKGNVIAAGSPNVNIEHAAAARIGDALSIKGTITSGNPTVFINSKPAAQVSSLTDNAGLIISGSTEVSLLENPPNAVAKIEEPEHWKPSMNGIKGFDWLISEYGLIDLGPAGSSAGCGGGADIWFPPDRILDWNFRAACDRHDEVSYAWDDPKIADEDLRDVLAWQAEIFNGIYNATDENPIFAVIYSSAVTTAALGQYSYWSLFKIFSE